MSSKKDQLQQYLQSDNINLSDDLFQQLFNIFLQSGKDDLTEFYVKFQDFLDISDVIGNRIDSAFILLFANQYHLDQTLDVLDTGNAITIFDHDATLDFVSAAASKRVTAFQQQQQSSAGLPLPSVAAATTTSSIIPSTAVSSKHNETSSLPSLTAHFDLTSANDSVLPSTTSSSSTTTPLSALFTPSKRPQNVSNNYSTPRTVGSTNSSAQQSPWTSILASPATSLHTTSQSGKVVASYICDKLNNEQQSLFASIESPFTAPTSILPIFNLSYIMARSNTRSRRQKVLPSASSYNEYISSFLPHDPLAPRTPFHYMDWNNLSYQNTIAKTEKHNKDLENSFFYSYIVQNHLDPQNTFKKQQEQLLEDNGGIDLVYPRQTVFTQTQIKNAWYFGHIKDTVSTSPEQRLTMSTITLSNNATEMPLRLDNRELLQYSLFPGQNILIRGTNVTGKYILPDRIYSETTLDSYLRYTWIARYYMSLYLPLKQALEKKKQEILRRQVVESNENAGSLLTATTTTTSNILPTGPRNLFQLANDKAPSEAVAQVNTTPVSQTLPEIQAIENEIKKIPTKEQLSTIIPRQSHAIFCAGPFTSAKGSTQALSSIVKLLTNATTPPDILILSGPFINPNDVRYQYNEATNNFSSDVRVFNDPSQDPIGKVSDMMHETPTPTSTNDNNTTQDKSSISLCNVPVYKSDYYKKLSSATESMDSSSSSSSEVCSYQDLFNQLMDSLITTLNQFESLKNLTIITIPSVQDLHHFPTFPQHAFSYQYPSSISPSETSPQTTTMRIINAPNPVVLDINGTTLAITTNDSLFDLSRYELSFVADSRQISQIQQQQKLQQQRQNQPKTETNSASVPSTPSSSSSHVAPLEPSTHVNIMESTPSSTASIQISRKEKRTVRLLSHILSQQSLAPVSTTQYNHSLEEQTQTNIRLAFTPDIMLLPSRLHHYVEAIPIPGCLSSLEPIKDPSDEFLQTYGHVLAINPEYSIKGENLGYYASIKFCPPSLDGNNRDDILKRCSAEVIHL